MGVENLVIYPFMKTVIAELCLVRCPIWGQEWCTGCRRAAGPVWPCGQQPCSSGTPNGNWGRCPWKEQTKHFAVPQAAGGLSITAVATSVLPGGCCPQILPTSHSPQLALTGATGKKGASSSRACGKPGITSPNLAEGYPEEKMLITHCLKQWPGAAVKMPKAFLALSTGSLPDTEGGDFFLSFF